MGEPIENLYFNWLCAKVLSKQVPIYYDLLKILHKTEFVWVVPADRHRAAEGIDLRLDFLRESNQCGDSEWDTAPCSFLEFLIAFSKRAAFQTDTQTRAWFWEFMENLKLDEYRQVSDRDEYVVKDILDTFLWRHYTSKGYGGMFPISRTQHDQRDIEIWYQFSEYLIDRGFF